MQTVVANRVGWGQLPEGTDPARCVALLDCDRIGDVVWVEIGDEMFGPLTVADCAARPDKDRLKKLGWAVDLAYEIMPGMDRPMKARVYGRDPRGGPE